MSKGAGKQAAGAPGEGPGGGVWGRTGGGKVCGLAVFL